MPLAALVHVTRVPIRLLSKLLLVVVVDEIFVKTLGLTSSKLRESVFDLIDNLLQLLYLLFGQLFCLGSHVFDEHLVIADLVFLFGL